MLPEVGKMIGQSLYRRLQVKPRQSSRFTTLVGGVVCAKMIEGYAFYDACSLLGFSSATIARWKRWADAGEDPYAAFLECADLAQRAYLSGKWNADPDQADYVLRRLTAEADTNGV